MTTWVVTIQKNPRHKPLHPYIHSWEPHDPGCQENKSPVVGDMFVVIFEDVFGFEGFLGMFGFATNCPFLSKDNHKDDHFTVLSLKNQFSFARKIIRSTNQKAWEFEVGWVTGKNSPEGIHDDGDGNFDKSRFTKIGIVDPKMIVTTNPPGKGEDDDPRH